jgi:hypothetical protein
MDKVELNGREINGDAALLIGGTIEVMRFEHRLKASSV